MGVLAECCQCPAGSGLGPCLLKAGSAGCRTLSLDGCRQLPFIDAGLEALKGLACVAVLNLQGCLTLTDLGLAAIAQMRSLACLNLQDCSSISGALLQARQSDVCSCCQGRVTGAGAAAVHGGCAGWCASRALPAQAMSTRASAGCSCVQARALARGS